MRFVLSVFLLSLVSPLSIVAQDDADPSNDAMCPAMEPDHSMEDATPCPVGPDVLCAYNAFVCPGSMDVQYLSFCQCDDMVGFVCQQSLIDCLQPGPALPEVQITTTQVETTGETPPEVQTTSETLPDVQTTSEALPELLTTGETPPPEVQTTVQVGTTSVTPDSTCPLESPNIGDACVFEHGEDLRCRYNAAACPSARFRADIVFLKQCQCFSTNKWVCVEEELECSPEDMDHPCNIDVDPFGDSCDEPGLQCNYNPSGCPGATNPGVFTTSCTCDGGEFLCSSSFSFCEDPTEPPMMVEEVGEALTIEIFCPDTQPGAGDSCDFSFDPTKTCRYDAFACPGSNERDDISFLTTCECSNGQFICFSASVDCGPPPTDATCPVNAAPSSGDMCDAPGLVCNYDPYGCPALIDDGLYTTRCECDGTEYTCNNFLVVCPLQEGEIPEEATTCPLSNSGPAPGDPCDFGGDDMKSCRYDPFTCPGSDDPGDISFRTNCMCDSTTNKFVCTSTSVDCLPTVNPCPSSRASSGDGCVNAGLRCSYDPFGCPDGLNDGIFLTSCTCLGTEFLCSQALPVCINETPNTPMETVTSCPDVDQAPDFGHPCDFGDEDVTCRYSPTVCPGSDDPNAIVFQKQCRCDAVTKQFDCLLLDIDCASQTNDCPIMPGGECEDDMLTCVYDPFGCPEEGSESLFLSSCTCDGSVFSCASGTPPMCPLENIQQPPVEPPAEPPVAPPVEPPVEPPSVAPEPPATSCPLFGEDAPSTGDSCNFSGKCRYNAFVCPGINNVDVIIFQTQCECNTMTNEFICVEVAVDCPPIETDCPVESPLVAGDSSCGTADLACNYDPFGCPSGNTAFFTTSCTCDGSQFICSQALPICNDIPEPTVEPVLGLTECPPYDMPPSVGDTCDFSAGDMDRRCRYNPLVCPGFQNREAITFTTECQCEDNQFSCSQTDIQCVLPETDCPAMASSGDSCDSPNLLCSYEPFGCPDETNFGVFLKKCTCDGSTFDCTETPPTCDALPLIDCPFPIQDPLTGDACNFEDDDKNCRYNAFACAESQDTTGITYLKNCKCDAGKLACEEDMPPTCDPPVDPICPINFQPVGSQCDMPGYKCNYSPFGCPNTDDDDGIFRISCTCDGTLFTCEQRVVVCTQSVAVPPQQAGGFCFAGDATVEVQDKGTVPMKDLVIGDMVLVDSSGRFEAIYSFGHRQPDASGDFVEVNLQDSTKNEAIPLRLSASHMLWEESSRAFLPAALLETGHVLVLAGGEEKTVDAIRHNVKDRGMFAPFTPSGQIVVNGIVVSCYVALEADKGSLPIGLFGYISVSHQWIAHSFEFPHRLACHYLGRCPNESYDKDGISTWVSAPLKIIQWVLSQNALVRTIILSIAAIALSLMTAIEYCMLNPFLLVSIILAAAVGTFVYRPVISTIKIKVL